jgi:outer membrane protein assembly factor BamB
MRLYILSLLLLPTVLLAQQEFPKVWETKFTVDPKWNAVSPDLAYVVAGDMEEIEMLDGATGKALWKYNFKEKHGVKKCEDWATHHENETVEVIIKKGRNDPTETVFLDYRTGNVVGASQLPARKKEKKGPPPAKGLRTRSVNQSTGFDEASNTTIELGYDSKRIISAKGGTDLNITVDASGGHTWSANFTGRVVRHLTNDYLPADDGEVILNVTTGFGKVFVVYEGITCLDLASGKLLWSTTFDNVETSTGLKAKQEIGRSAMPLASADGVYICDFSKGERAIKKLDLTTGAVLWQADKLKKDDIVSEMLLDGGNLIVRFGGLIRVEQYIPGMNGNPDVYKVEYVFEGSTSIRAYSAATGVPVWNTGAMELEDNFKKSECNILSGDGRIYACGEKNMYIFDVATGKLLKQGEYNAKTIGKARALYQYGDNYMVEGMKGIAQMNAELQENYATNTDKCLMTEMRGDAFIVWTGKDQDDRKEFIRFDLANGAIIGKMEDCYRPRFNATGDRFVRFNNPKVMMYRTN